MTFLTFIIILTGVLLNAFAQLALKSCANILLKYSDAEIVEKVFVAFSTWQLYVGLSFYVVSVSIWIVALMRVPVSVGYPMLSIGYVINAIIAYFLFDEPITLTKFLGISVILIGVFLLAKA